MNTLRLRVLAALTITISLAGPLAALDPAKTVMQYAHRIWGQEEGLFQPTIYSISQTPDGFLWLGTQDSLIRFDGARFREFAGAEQAGLHNALIRALLVDGRGDLWVGSIGSGLARIARDGTVKRFTTADGWKSDSAFCLSSDAQGRIWACTGEGLARYDAGRFTYISADPARASCEASSGERWIAGQTSGLTRLKGTKAEMYTDAHVSKNSPISALLCASDGSIWAGTDAGPVRIRNGASRLFTAAGGLPDNAVSSFIEGRNGIWIGSNDGLSRYRDGEFSVYRTRDGLSHSLVLALFEDAEGSLWAGTKDGLDQFTDGKVTPYTTAEGMTSNEAGPVIEDQAGKLWVGTLGQGLNYFDGKSFHSVKLPDNTVLRLEIDRNGDLLAGTKKGLSRLRNGNVIATYPAGADTRTLSRYPVNGVARPVDCYYADPAHDAAWLGTLGSGLLYWQNGKVTHVWVKDGLYDSRIYSILKDDHANFWMASSKGIFRVSEKELEDFVAGRVRNITSIPFSTGQLRFECRAGVQPAAYKTRDGRMWFATTNGLVVVDPNHLITNRVAPPVAIASVFLNGQRVDALNAIDVKPRFERNIEIRYAGLSFVSPEKVTFRYIMEGYDKTWTDAGSRREAFFTNLPPGEFQFKVVARNADGIWSRNAASLQLTIEPRLYQRAWFLPLLGILVGLGIAAGYRMRIRRLKRTFNIVIAERSRIARELHDTLLQGLSGITMQLQALWSKLPPSKERNFLREIIQDAGRCSTEARQSLWGLRSRESDAADLPERLAQLAKRATSVQDIALTLDIEPLTVSLSPEIEYQLMRISHEALSNVVKHSQASSITVRLKCQAGVLQLCIKDDGIGFDTSAAQFDHFGLTGIQERALEIGADVDVVSGRGIGTKISLRLNVRGPVQQAAGNREQALQHQIK